jgi:hypothetical protein
VNTMGAGATTAAALRSRTGTLPTLEMPANDPVVREVRIDPSRVRLVPMDSNAPRKSTSEVQIG